METVITTVILVCLLLLAVVGLAQYTMSAQATIADSSRVMQERVGERSRTDIASISAAVSPMGDQVQVTLKNSGSTKLADYFHWDVILQYSDGVNSQIKWYPYGAGQNQWSVSGIYQSISPLVPEAYEIGIFDPGEYIVATVNITPTVGIGTSNLAVVGTPNGITASTVFTH